MKHRTRWLFVLLVALGLIAVSCGRSNDADNGASANAAGDSADCGKETPKATEIGVSADTITIEISADVGSPLAPGLFQGNVDGIKGFASWVNDHGGLACRKLVVKEWDSKLSADESKNGQIDACRTAYAMVGSNSLFNPNTTAMVDCTDKAGKATGLPDITALAADANQQCSATSYSIQPVVQCPLVTGVRSFKAQVGPYQYLQKQLGPLHGAYVVGGDFPALMSSSLTVTAGIETTGVKIDDYMRTSAVDEQAAYTPRILRLKAENANWVNNGSNDDALIKMRKEAKAQGLDASKITWSCTLACYTKRFVAAGADVDGTYLWLEQLPFEERATNKNLDAFLTELGTKADSFAANSWQAGLAFKEAVDRIVSKDGVNGLTRGALLAELENFGEFDAGGWVGKKPLRGISPCFMLMQFKDGKYRRVFPTKPGTFDCAADNIATVKLDLSVGVDKWH